MSRQSQMVREHRKRQIAALYLQGKWQSEIATIVGCSQTQVSYDLKLLQKRWYHESIADIDQRKAQELQRLDAVERAAWEGWERSLQPREMTLTEAREGPQPGRKASVRKEGQAGDPRFLEQVHKCIAKRCEILGLLAPQKVAPTTPDGVLPYQGQGLAGLLALAQQPLYAHTDPTDPN